MIEFSAKIFKIGINPVIDPPDDVLKELFARAGKSKGPIPVCGKLDGAEFIQTLVKYQGAWRLYVNGQMLKDSGLKIGDTAKIEIEFDLRPRIVPVPKELARVLAKNKKAKAAFEALIPSRQKEILRYLESLKTEESLVRNVDKVVKHLVGEKTDTLHALMRREKSV